MNPLFIAFLLMLPSTSRRRAVQDATAAMPARTPSSEAACDVDPSSSPPADTPQPSRVAAVSAAGCVSREGTSPVLAILLRRHACCPVLRHRWLQLRALAFFLSFPLVQHLSSPHSRFPPAARLFFSLTLSQAISLFLPLFFPFIFGLFLSFSCSLSLCDYSFISS